MLRLSVAVNATDEHRAFLLNNPMRPDQSSGAGHCALERRTIHIHDIRADPQYTYGFTALLPPRTLLAVPMIKGDQLLGVITVFHHEVRSLTKSRSP
jgi:GAF domain-containing protein